MPEGTTREILADLIGFPTVSRDSNRQLIDYCAGLLGDVGVDSPVSYTHLTLPTIYSV